MRRRALLASIGAALVGASGCSTVLGTSTRPAHTVSVYLVDDEVARDVSVTVENDAGESVFSRDYRLSESTQAHEDATFPKSSAPETVTVTVDGTRFVRDWPGFEAPRVPCEGDNWVGVEVWIERGPDGAPSVRVQANCQHVTMD
ncbi:MAG: hypothetical protein ABEJ68_02025 [Halobacteriaceae archaeon]